MNTPHGKTGKEMCEEIAAWLKTKGRDIKPEAIWNASPTGELWHVFALYHQLRHETHGVPAEPLPPDLQATLERILDTLRP